LCQLSHNEEFQMYSLQPIENNVWSQPCPMQLLL
jgi:hypothetical protein